MAKTRVLDAEAKGTGAAIVPLERALKQKRSGKGVAIGRRSRASRLRQEPEPVPVPAPRGPRQFKLISAITCRVVAEGVSVRETVELLERARSLVDVRVYVRETELDEWRPLTLRETRALRGLPS